MKPIRYIVFVLLVAMSSTASAQSSERYDDLLHRTETLPAYEQMYHMLAFQRTHPEHAPIYYRLGDAAYSMLPSKDALHDYSERSELLYRARLFYGNCLHFMGGKMPRGESFPTITPAGKKVEFADVDTYLRARLDTVKRWRAETDTLHDRFYRMVDRYESCRQLFMQFMEKYPSEKLAHLSLTEDDRENLRQLSQLMRLFEQDRKLFTEALRVSPVAGYTPEFRQVAITAYRLDGLTSSDFLANDIPLWDYASWTATFFDVQQRVYLPFMRDLIREFTTLDGSMERFRLRQSVQIEPDRRLPYRVERYDYKSPIAAFIRLEQQVAGITLQAQDSLTANEQITDGELSARITANIEAKQHLAESETLLRTLKQTADEATARKFDYFLRETKMLTIEQLVQTAEQAFAFQQQLTQQINQQLQNYAAAYPKQFKDVDISDDFAASQAAEAAAK